MRRNIIDTQSQNVYISEDLGIGAENYALLSMTALIARSEVPPKHKQIAGNYMVIKKIYGYTSVPFKITNAQEALLKNYEFKTLESTTAEQINKELDLLRKMSLSGDENLMAHSDEIFEIRVQELKYLYASNYFPPDGEIYDGWKLLEKYIEAIGQ